MAAWAYIAVPRGLGGGAHSRDVGTVGFRICALDIQEVGVASGLSIAMDREGRIAAIGPDHEVDSRMDGCSFERCIDASGMSVVPGLVDAHTHPVWVGDRVHEFAMKVRH